VHRAGEIAAADRMRTALLNAVSHDLRTPLASIKAAITSLRSEDIRWDRETEKELLSGADRELDRLNDLLGNLLDLSRLEAGALNLALGPTSLEEVIASALDTVHAGDAVDVVLEPSLPEVTADAVLVERVLANLIDNALRFQPATGRVRVFASSYGAIVEVRVIDCGPGIPPEERESVFEAFQRRDDRESRAGAGVGLGLAIARGFTEAMGGSLHIDDTPGGGLTMVVTLNRAEEVKT
jgi:two-component system sensor histidine kinase KdpD